MWCERVDGLAEFSVNISPKRHGKGFGSEAIRLGSDHAYTDWGVPIMAWIRKDNTASVKAFEKAGYTYWGSADRQGIPALVYRYPGVL